LHAHLGEELSGEGMPIGGPVVGEGQQAGRIEGDRHIEYQDRVGGAARHTEA
jgi:hypothetical protein